MVLLIQDLFFSYVSLYNTAMKIFFISSSVYTLYLMKFTFKPTNDPHIDSFRAEYLVGGSAVMAFIFTYKYTIAEVRFRSDITSSHCHKVLWSFSIWLESVAILPQLFMIQRTGEAENITTHYLFALGAYRGFYVLNWIWRSIDGFWDPIAFFAGLVQTALYSDFAYLYFTKVLKGERFELPA
jgi:ER lumen protein retaining receptor